MATNMTSTTDLPPLPAYSVTVAPDLISWLPDFYLSIIAPTLAYWVISIFFHVIDTLDLFPQYRLHTPAEIAQRNKASRYEVLRDVLFQQVIQAVMSFVLGMTDPPQYTGMEEYDVAVWATRVRLSQRALPAMLNIIGINAASMSKNMAVSHPLLAGVLAGGHYPFLTELAGSGGIAVPTFATWELLVAKAIYWGIIPALQLFLAVTVLDTWQYFLHRIMHQNKWLYTTFHSRHHRLYVPYAYGALYNHPFEGFLLDTAGAGLAYKVAFMTPRQGIFFWVMSSIKTVDDHCGYALPWDPLQHMTSNNAAYHDIHHQSWGIKTNFSQPFFTFWDKLLGTMWHGDTSLKYERSRTRAQEFLEAEAKKASEKAQ
ncbi:fatty acid hydroxylase superfamily-domain-containing protein [Annulohypoxylon maeteangense]|uniref:fatty acid hydroxylase superfamily-domain-containing protein n=1 Tax=Annulohypoxylon maeteangense TaxID=1927788 RepID=UPI0020082D55|nr:fatty acid hydroxylase superfamily-domain-containing protein [Annulohypoxylon maeteangense]KAI0887203.1 fatty acid hydroxylase superfamily-domain-containing protein [Annulohypoxylon maeteangense]